MFHRTVDEDFVQLSFQSRLQAVAQAAHLHALFRHVFLRDFAGFAEAHNAGHVQRAGAHAALMAAAVNDGGKLHARIAAPDIQGADALGPVNLVPADGQEVDVVLLNVHGDFANGLHTVYGKENPALFGNLADFRDGVDDANFVIGVHDGDQNRGRLNGRFQTVQADTPILLHRQIGDLETMLLKVLASIEHSFVLDGLGDDVVALLAEHFRDALDHQVVGLDRKSV